MNIKIRINTKTLNIKIQRISVPINAKPTSSPTVENALRKDNHGIHSKSCKPWRCRRLYYKTLPFHGVSYAIPCMSNTNPSPLYQFLLQEKYHGKGMSLNKCFFTAMIYNFWYYVFPSYLFSTLSIVGMLDLASLYRSTIDWLWHGWPLTRCIWFRLDCHRDLFSSHFFAIMKFLVGYFYLRS